MTDTLHRARDLYQKGEMHDALEAAQAACERKPKDAEAWWLLGCISRYTGLPAASDAAFRRAAELSRKRPSPVRVDARRFQAIIDEARAGLTRDAARRLQATRVGFEPLPPVDLVRAGVAPDATAHRRRQPEDVLTLYQVNLENRAGSEVELAKLVGRVLARA